MRAGRRAVEASPVEPGAAAPGLRGDVIERLRPLCEAAGAVAVLLHWYRGDVDTARVAVKQRQTCNGDELGACAARLEEDELLLAVARRRPS